MSDIDRTLPPQCPLCAGKTALKEMHKDRRTGFFMCVFKCIACFVEYPRSVESELIHLAALGSEQLPKPSV